jgi:hypothetical protein
MLKEETFKTAKNHLKRIFSLKVSRSTFREVQNAILQTSNGNEEEANALFETLLNGVPSKKTPDAAKASAEELVKEFSIPVRLSKEINERGDFISMIASDTLTKGDQFALVHLVKKIDGEEFRFMTDFESTMQLLNHVMARVEEMSKLAAAKPLFKEKREKLESIKKKAEAIADAAK